MHLTRLGTPYTNCLKSNVVYVTSAAGNVYVDLSPPAQFQTRTTVAQDPAVLLGLASFYENIVQKNGAGILEWY